jgi:5'-AMP-activated protein kinase catalytic alpha subunit
MAKRLRLKVKKKENGVLKLAAPKEGKKGFLELDAEIFEVAPSFLLVELKKTNGDTMEYQRLVKEEVRPSLKDIVWVWQGEQQQNSEPIVQGDQQQPPLAPPDQLQPPLQQQEIQDQLHPPSPHQEQQDLQESPLPWQNGLKQPESHASRAG